MPWMHSLDYLFLVRACTTTTVNPQKGWVLHLLCLEVSLHPTPSTYTCCLLPHPCSCAIHWSASHKHLMHISGLKWFFLGSRGRDSKWVQSPRTTMPVRYLFEEQLWTRKMDESTQEELFQVRHMFQASLGCWAYGGIRRFQSFVKSHPPNIPCPFKIFFF